MPYDDGIDPTSSLPPSAVSTLDQDDIGDGDWEIGAFAYVPEGDTTAPVFSSASVNAGGDELTVNFIETDTWVEQGGSWNNNQINIDCTSGDDISLVYLSGNESNTHVFRISQMIWREETCDLDFIGSADVLRDNDENDMVAFADETISNGSESVRKAAGMSSTGAGVSIY
jgi:hypothetical protein